jgi:UDP-N-acetylmuramoylalanine--D-glutamate ligase
MSGAFADVRAVVLGAGVAGRAAATALAAEGAHVTLTDAADVLDAGAASALGAHGIDVRVGTQRPDDFDGAELVVTSPGIPPSAPVLGWAAARGLAVVDELEIGARLVRVPYVGVTGTNGKTTTTGMIASCLRAGGVRAAACGNIGHPFSTAARDDLDALVVEVSSFQLARQRSFRPRVSALLNLAPDHLDHHGSFDAYRDAKAAVFALQRDGDVHVGNAEDDLARAVSSGAPCERRWFRGRGAPDDGTVGYREGELAAVIGGGEVALGEVDATRAGQRENAAAAAAVALAWGVGPDAIRTGLAAFEPQRHRGEEVASVDGVRFLDNSKATNVHAALAAIAAVDDAVLIAGGRAKGQELASLADGVAHLRGVVAVGEATDGVVAAFVGAVPVERAGSIEEATRRAFAMASRPGTVLLAPACASWDQFSSYVERGDRFAVAARSLREEVATGG